MDALWLVLDIGTSSAKAALIDSENTVVASTAHAYQTFSAAGGVNEQDALDWWRAVLAVCAQLGTPIQQVSAVAVTGQMQNAILIDPAGTPVHPVILYNDTRAHAEAAAIIDRFGVENLIDLTGNEQGADSLWAKLAWLAHHQPGAAAACSTILFGAADFIVRRMSGMAVTDVTTASTTGLLDLRARGWLSAAVLDEMGIGWVRDRLPMLMAGGAHCGALTPAAAAETGLRAGIPVYLAPGDAGAATIGAGSGEPGRAYAYLGTSGWIAFTTLIPGNPLHGVFTLAHPRFGHFIQIAPLLTAAGNLEWVRDLFQAGDVEPLIDQAADRPPTSILYLPYLNGERTPFRDPLARAAFIGIGSTTTQADLVRAVLEGVAFGYHHALDALMPRTPDRLTLTGGGARSRAWCQLFADILGIEIGIAGESEFVGVRGALKAVQVASGKTYSYHLNDYPPAETVLTPNPAYAEQYRAKYSQYRAAYPALRSVFTAMGEQRPIDDLV
ncbi:MAG: FGGY family carbohydrate kinase [bacterium]|nr:FGGY family carbohydrate kinase [bacterium]